MKARTLLLQILLLASLGVQAQKHEFANWNRYAQDNKTIGLPAKGEHRVVLMGNSITDGWPRTRPQFFAARTSSTCIPRWWSSTMAPMT